MNAPDRLLNIKDTPDKPTVTPLTDREAAILALAEARRFVATPSTMSEAESVIAALTEERLAAALHEVPTVKFLTRSFRANDVWWTRFAGEILAALEASR